MKVKALLNQGIFGKVDLLNQSAPAGCNPRGAATGNEVLMHSQGIDTRIGGQAGSATLIQASAIPIYRDGRRGDEFAVAEGKGYRQALWELQAYHFDEWRRVEQNPDVERVEVVVGAVAS